MRRLSFVVLASFMLLVLCLTAVMAQATAPVVAQSSSVAQTPSEAAPAQPGYVLHKEDMMKIIVWNEPNFSVDQELVDPNGDIEMPELGQIHAAGMTVRELTDNIIAGLKTYIREPKVEIELLVLYKRTVFVAGQVNHPSSYVFTTGNRVSDAIAMAGSYTDDANLHAVKLTRKDATTTIPIDLDKLYNQGDMSQNPELEDGDAIFVPEDTMGKFSVIGLVQRPGQFKWKKDMTIMDGISVAGGTMERADLTRVWVLRGDPKNPNVKKIRLNIEKMVKSGDLSANGLIEPGDLIYVPETGKPDWSKIGNLMSTVVSGFWIWHYML